MSAQQFGEQEPFITESHYLDSRIGVEYVHLEATRRSDWLGTLPPVFIPTHDLDKWTCSVGEASATAADLRTYAEAILAALDRSAPPAMTDGGER